MVEDFVISRTFNVPRDMLWKCFTDPERMKEWWGPKGFKVITSKMDLRAWRQLSLRHADRPTGQPDVGQVRLSRNRPAGEAGASSTRFRTRRAARRAIPWTCRAGRLQMLSTFTFEELPGGKTKFTVRWAPHNATEAEAQDLRRRPRQHDARLERHLGTARSISWRQPSSARPERSSSMTYVDGFVLPVKKQTTRRLIAAWPSRPARSGASTARWNFTNVSPTTFRTANARRFRAASSSSAARPSCFLTSSTGRAADRDRVMAKVMKDKRIDAMMKSKKMPFDGKRMIFGGFKTMVSA